VGRHILVPVDSSEPAWRALEHALSFHTGGQITVLHVIDPQQGDYRPDGSGDSVYRRSEKIADEVTQRFEGADVPSTELTFETIEGKPKNAILRFESDADVDQIIIGSRGNADVKRLLLGSVAETVARRSDCPVTIVN